MSVRHETSMLLAALSGLHCVRLQTIAVMPFTLKRLTRIIALAPQPGRRKRSMLDRSRQIRPWSVRPHGRAALQRLYRDQSRARRPLSRSLLAPDESLSKRLLFARLSLFNKLVRFSRFSDITLLIIGNVLLFICFRQKRSKNR